MFLSVASIWFLSWLSWLSAFHHSDWNISSNGFNSSQLIGSDLLPGRSNATNSVHFSRNETKLQPRMKPTALFNLFVYFGCFVSYFCLAASWPFLNSISKFQFRKWRPISINSAAPRLPPSPLQPVNTVRLLDLHQLNLMTAVTINSLPCIFN